MTGTQLNYLVATVFAILVPLAVLFGRFAVKRQRQSFLKDLLETLRHATGTDVALIPSFEYALQKYDLTENQPRRSLAVQAGYYASTAVIFVLLSWAGFVFMLIFATGTHLSPNGLWEGSNLFLFSGFASGIPADGAYPRFSAGVLTFAFLGSYIWSINYLIGRIANFDLSPVSFLRVSGKIILACAIALALRHVFGVDGSAAGLGGVPEALVLVMAFLIGCFPDAGLDYLMQKVPQLRMKRPDDATAALLRTLPVDVIDGIDSNVGFRLAEREILDVQNLATENPILLCAETPYTPLECLDWIAQAQLVLEVGARAYKDLRAIGIRTILALEEVGRSKELEQTVLRIIYGDAAPPSLEAFLASARANVHVLRLRQIHRILRKVYDQDEQPAQSAPAPGGPKPDNVVDLPLPDGQPPAAVPAQ